MLNFTYGVTINGSADKVQTKSSNNQDKRSLLFGDLSYSYSATDIGSEKGSHVKTITVIKNIGAPKFHKHPHHPYDEWDNNSKNRFNFVFKFPEFPEIDTGTFFQTEKPRKVIPTKQPTDRQTPVIDTDFNTNDFDDQPNVNVNTNNVPQVSEKSPEGGPELGPEASPDPTTKVSTENPITKEASDEVEYIQTDGEQSKSTMPTPAKFHSNKVQPSRERSSHGYRVNAKTSGNKQGNRQASDFIEDFSEYSMHNVKHLVDPMTVKDSLMKYTQNQSKIDLKKLTNVESDKKYDSYGNVVQKSQSLTDANPSSPYRNTQPSKRPYISPSLKKAYNSPSQAQPKITTTTSGNGLIFFSTTQKPYVAPNKSKLSESPSTKSIEQPLHQKQTSEQMLKFEFQQSPTKYEQKANYNSPPKQLKEEKKPEQQFHSHSIRNPLTTSLPVQHNRQEPLKQQPKLQSYVAVPVEADMPSTYSSEGSKLQSLMGMPKRYVRHHIVFDSRPPHPFMESPFRPIKAILMG